MPRKPIDYSNCVMYQIKCNDPEVDHVYVGHTTDFTKRKYQHKSNSKSCDLKLYQTIRENGGWDNFKMLQVEPFPCDNRREAQAREDQLMTELKANMNQYRACRTIQQYKEANKERIAEQRKQHYQENKERINEQKKQCREANKERINEQNKQYWEANKQQINERRRASNHAKKQSIAAATSETADTDIQHAGIRFLTTSAAGRS
jgi:hypothetical protein